MLLSNIYDADWFRRTGTILLEGLATHLARAQEGDEGVYPGLSPADMLARWRNFDLEAWDTGDFFQRVIDDSIHLHHPRYIGHQVVPPAPLSALAELLAAFLNNGMAIYEMGPASTAIERLVIERTCRMLGMPEGSGGFLTSGGSAGNLTALLTARQVMSGHEAWNKGNPGRWGVMVSAHAHYSVERAVKIMGFGEEGVIRVPTRGDLSLDPSALEETYRSAVTRGIRPFAIVGNACTTGTGTYDPLDEIAAFARYHELWFHVDGAHGAAAGMVPEYAGLTEGMQRADSLVVDYHKMLMAPALTTAVLYQRDKDSYTTFSQDADYLLRAEEDGEWYNSAGRSLECTKIMMSLRPYVLMKEYGEEGFRAFIRTTFGMARHFAGMVASDASFELFMPPQANIVVFRLKGGDASNVAARERLLKDGRFYIVRTQLDGKVWLRTTFMNPFTHSGHLEELLLRLKAMARE